MEVIKRDGKRVPYDRDRIKIAIEKANRDVDFNEQATKEDIDALCDALENVV